MSDDDVPEIVEGEVVDILGGREGVGDNILPQVPQNKAIELAPSKRFRKASTKDETFLIQSKQQDRYAARKMKLFLDALRQTGKIGIALRQSNLGAGTTLGLWRRRYPWFDRAIDEVMMAQLDEVEDRALEMAKTGESDGRMTRWMLEKRKPEKYGKKAESTGNAGIRIHIDQVTYDAI